MLRRRRPQSNEAIHFSFDSFLDLVTNVVGIIIRLILVTWVGARSYHASMQWVEPTTPPPAAPVEQTEPVQEMAPPKLSDDPLYSKIEIAKQEIEQAKARLTAQLKDLHLAEQKTETSKAQLFTLASRRSELEMERKRLESQGGGRSPQIQLVSQSAAELRQRSKRLLEEIKLIEAQPANTKQLKYHAPLSRAVHSDEIFFECKNGRVTFIDLPSFLLEIKQSMDNIAVELRSQWKVEHTTASVGPYRLRYVVERERSAMDAGTAPAGERNYRYGLSGWIVEPLAAERGETLERALAPKSDFRQLVDPLDGRISVVTFWVYPDSFEMFRQLRDYLYERGMDVAGRPLPPGAPIAASKYGSASRGQ